MKQRVYLKRANASEYVYLAWFELKEPHDLYWGPPSAGLDIESTIVEPNGTTGLLDLNAPDDWDKLPTAHHKHSYHESGLRHTTAGGSGAATITDSEHMPLAALSGPMLLCGVLTGIPAKYPLYHRNLNRHNSRAVILGMTDDDQWFNMRHYFEFYVTPAGAYLPPPLVNVGAEHQQRQPAYSSLSVDLDRILAIRHIQVPLAEDVDDRQTNAVAFWIIPGRPAR
jgi:hypothetical protein